MFRLYPSCEWLSSAHPRVRIRNAGRQPRGLGHFQPSHGRSKEKPYSSQEKGHRENHLLKRLVHSHGHVRGRKGGTAAEARDHTGGTAAEARGHTGGMAAEARDQRTQGQVGSRGI